MVLTIGGNKNAAFKHLCDELFPSFTAWRAESVQSHRVISIICAEVLICCLLGQFKQMVRTFYNKAARVDDYRLNVYRLKQA